ncbi:MAG: hypothetical protein MZV49_03325 [Rhodopseudomonas palustris]|nr:hypothetical protein [Rhodopseudomonas palustris]
MVAPSGEGADALHAAWRCRPPCARRIDYINAARHLARRSATSPELERDPRGVRRRRRCRRSAPTKSLTGHSLGAAGVQEAIYSLLMMNNGFICASRQHRRRSTRRPRTCRSCASASTTPSSAPCCPTRFGFGGTNATLVFKHIDA